MQISAELETHFRNISKKVHWSSKNSKNAPASKFIPLKDGVQKIKIFLAKIKYCMVDVQWAQRMETKMAPMTGSIQFRRTTCLTKK